MSYDVKPYPLHWPIGRARTPDRKRKRAVFGQMKAAKRADGSVAGYKQKKPWSFEVTRTDLLAELELMRATHVVVSTDLPLRQDGAPYANRRVDDPGIAVYFRRKVAGSSELRAYAMACDQYDRLSDNCRALVLTVGAMRKIERHGSSDLMEQAFSGFTALPAPGARDWPAVMGIDPSWVGSSGLDVEAEVGRKYLEFVKRHHPDRGGDPDVMRRVNIARDAAIAYLSKLGTLPWTGAAS